ncbi:hypothetical protein ANSO36C_31200 [Nostoc cf. commune SO-36]|uniref:Phosphonate ABC transporter, permease protein PhnE n=1 Tax=Nostoc cf. commune SO-36 TaxID=449208 RepID=A0ABN6Q215_NOSCO|nr:hypothetical protein ANSO36C_31200 [Nostoc cf. commune SO-36]
MSSFFKLKRLRFYPWLSSLLILLIVVVVYGWALRGLKLDFELLRSSWPYITDFITRLFPPDWKVLDIAIKALIETVQMSLWGTTIGAILSVPIGYS